MQLWSFVLSILLFVHTSYASETAAPIQPAAELLEGLSFYNNGQLLEASSEFEEYISNPDLQREAKFFLALTKWKMMWLSTYQKSERQDVLRLLEDVEQTSLSSVEPDIESMFYHAGSLGIRAQIAATDGNWWHTAQLGKKMKSEAEQILKKSPDYIPALYLMGSYNYFADALPDYIKFLRSLLFIPGGSRKKGSQQLVEAYQKGGMVQGEAGKTLTIIYTYFERNHKYGLQMSENYLTTFPGNYEVALYKGVNLYFLESWEDSLQWLQKLRKELLHYSNRHVQDAEKETEIRIVPCYGPMEREVRYWMARNLVQLKRYDEARGLLEELANPEIHQPYWLMRGVLLSMAQLDYLNSDKAAAESRVRRVLAWQDIKDSRKKAERLKKKAGKVDTFDLDFR